MLETFEFHIVACLFSFLHSCFSSSTFSSLLLLGERFFPLSWSHLKEPFMHFSSFMLSAILSWLTATYVACFEHAILRVIFIVQITSAVMLVHAFASIRNFLRLFKRSFKGSTVFKLDREILAKRLSKLSLHGT